MELLQRDRELVLGLVLVDLRQQLGLRSAGASGIAFTGHDADMFQSDLAGEDAVGPVGQFDRQRSSQGSRADRAVRNVGEVEPLSGGTVHPVAEGAVSGAEMERAEQQRPVAGIAVELLGDLNGPVDRFDDDPFVVGSAQGLSLDDRAGEAVAEEPGSELLGWAAAADLEFHQFAGSHPADRGGHQERRGAHDLRQDDDLAVVKGTGPWQLTFAGGGGHFGCLMPPRRAGTDLAERFFDRRTQVLQPRAWEVPDAGLGCQHGEAHRQYRIVGCPAGGEPLTSELDCQLWKGDAVADVVAQDGGEPLDRAALGLGQPSAGPQRGLALPRQRDNVRAQDASQVECCAQHRLQHLLVDWRCLVLPPAGLNVSDGRGGPCAPAEQIAANAVGGEQVTVVDQVEDDLDGHPAG
jgi:hypothetical protein